MLYEVIRIIGLILYWRVGVEKNPGDYNVRKGNYRLEDGQYKEAVKEFSEALGKNPEHAMARVITSYSIHYTKLYEISI